MRTGAYMAAFAAAATLVAPAFAPVAAQTVAITAAQGARSDGQAGLNRPALQTPGDLQQQQGRQTPEWYERFTFGSGFSSDANSWATSKRAPARLTWSPPQSSWGVTVDVDPTAKWTPLRQGDERERVAAGAFLMVSPRVRVGGEMGYELKPGETKPDELLVQPSVKLESAFRF